MNGKTLKGGEERDLHTTKKDCYRGNTYKHDYKCTADVEYIPECYRCGKRCHYQRDYRVKLKVVKCGLLIFHNRRLLQWMKVVRIMDRKYRFSWTYLH